ncbi:MULTISPECIES: GmrSD restriction endonuclease domain-containing protein [unclassified Microbacterium]|uniref:GmrSD restriction endonuclease domain-containing protein n=1 Tax=unclassified Microbacterium TaxID=2609290 RepID=UPI0030198881
MSKYTVQQHSVETLLTWVKSGQVAIPEMQRPFVWDSTKVRDLLDSLYNGFPIGYLITWQSADVGLKDGTKSSFRQILIDGQQRITAMTAALVGQPVVDKSYKKKRIKIAFNPTTEQFATLTPFIEKDSGWVSDVAEFVNAPSTYSATKAYMEANPEVDAQHVEQSLQRLSAIKQAQVGIINLAEDLDIETVTEIFIRINSKGVPLSSADFAMSKISSHGELGSNLRKLIDYFCHLAVAPHVFADIAANDIGFAESGYLQSISWLRNDTSDLYDPTYTDVIRVAGIKEFSRGKVAALVSVLSGRDFETRTFSEELAVESFDRLERVLLEIVNQHNFQQFTLTIKSAGFIAPRLISSKNAMNFAYALYLKLRTEKKLNEGEIKFVTRRWFVMSVLTGRYTGSFETAFEADIRRINDVGALQALRDIEASQLADNFWNVALPMEMQSSSVRSPYFLAFLAAQVHAGTRGFLSKNVTVASMIEEVGDIHHVVPKNYLIKQGINDRSVYNQIANFALTETPINIAIKDKEPTDYMSVVDSQLADGVLRLGEITSEQELEANLRANAIPSSLRTTTADSYQAFLRERRSLMAQIIREYYLAL